LRGKRDRALLLVGFAGALRRSELAAIRIDHLEKTDRGLRLTIPQTKGSRTDPVVVPLPYGPTELCPVRALNARLAAGITDALVFRRIWLPARDGARGRGKLPARGEMPSTADTRNGPPRVSPLPSPKSAKPRSPRSVAIIVRRTPSRPALPGGTSPATASKRGALTTGMERGIHPPSSSASAVTRALTC
jgi:hypothetical protein